MSTVVSSKFVMPFLLAALASPLALAEDCAAPQPRSANRANRCLRVTARRAIRRKRMAQ